MVKRKSTLFEWGGTSMIEDRGEIFPSLEVDPNHPAVQQLMSAHENIVKEQAVVDVSPSVTDGGWFGDAGIPAAIYGPGHLHHAHAVNEQVSIRTASSIYEGDFNLYLSMVSYPKKLV